MKNFFKLYNFEDGRPLEPDYVLSLRRKNTSKNLHYQIFIEPKGIYLKKVDAWKEKFLMSLKKENKVEKLWEDQEYVILGMPFYSKTEEKDFNEEFEKLL